MANRQTPDRNSWFKIQGKHNKLAISALKRHPLATLLTLLVIAISLTLPGMMLLALNNLANYADSWRHGAQINLYMHSQISESRGKQLAGELQSRSEINRAVYISSDKGLSEFLSMTGLSLSLERNPVPATIVLTPEQLEPDAIEVFYQETLLRLPEVEKGQLDLAWLQKLEQFLHFIERFAYALSFMLTMAVVLVMSNTIRMEVEARRDEITIVKLVGATNGFVRRPFMLMGWWYGLLGGLLAIIIINILYSYIKSPLVQLLSAYQGDQRIVGLGLKGSLTMLISAVFICLIAVRLSVSKQLNRLSLD